MLRLQREVEGLEEQRARAREDAKRSEAARQQLEVEIKVRPVIAVLLPCLLASALRHTRPGCLLLPQLAPPRTPCLLTAAV